MDLVSVLLKVKVRNFGLFQAGILGGFILIQYYMSQNNKVNILSTEKLEIELDVDLMTKLKTKADAANKTPSEMIAEYLREKLKE